MVSIICTGWFGNSNSCLRLSIIIDNVCAKDPLTNNQQQYGVHQIAMFAFVRLVFDNKNHYK